VSELAGFRSAFTQTIVMQVEIPLINAHLIEVSTKEGEGEQLSAACL
jgi:hypothetical protein